MNKAILLLLVISFQAQATLLDKIMAVIDENIITLSQVKRIKSTLDARAEISPQIYQIGLNEREIIDTEISATIVRKKLAELGYTITDENVDAQIQQTESRLRLSRKQLLEFLESKGIYFEEYFEISRKTIEFNLFFSRVIAPQVTITDQEIKNEFLKDNSASVKTSTFQFNLVDYSIDTGEIDEGQLKNFRSAVMKLHQDGTIDAKYKAISTNVFSQLSVESLDKTLASQIRNLNEGEYSQPILFNQEYHIFYVDKKDLIESSDYAKLKDRIKNSIFEDRAKDFVKIWYKRRRNKHFIKYY